MSLLAAAAATHTATTAFLFAILTSALGSFQDFQSSSAPLLISFPTVEW